MSTSMVCDAPDCFVTLRFCKNCGKQLVGRKQVKYCSNVCSAEARSMPKRPCERCGTPFSPTKRTSRYCSVACATPSRIVRQCTNCDKPARYRMHTCSDECAKARMMPRGIAPDYAITDKVLALYADGVPPTTIAADLTITQSRVRSIIRRATKGAPRRDFWSTDQKDVIMRMIPTYATNREIMEAVNALPGRRMAHVDTLRAVATRLKVKRPPDWATVSLVRAREVHYPNYRKHVLQTTDGSSAAHIANMKPNRANPSCIPIDAHLVWTYAGLGFYNIRSPKERQSTATLLDAVNRRARAEGLPGYVIREKSWRVSARSGSWE